MQQRAGVPWCSSQNWRRSQGLWDRTGCRAHFLVQELGRECHGWVGGSTPWGGSGKLQVGGKGRNSPTRFTTSYWIKLFTFGGRQKGARSCVPLSLECLQVAHFATFSQASRKMPTAMASWCCPFCTEDYVKDNTLEGKASARATLLVTSLIAVTKSPT